MCSSKKKNWIMATHNWVVTMTINYRRAATFDVSQLFLFFLFLSLTDARVSQQPIKAGQLHSFNERSARGTRTKEKSKRLIMKLLSGKMRLCASIARKIWIFSDFFSRLNSIFHSTGSTQPSHELMSSCECRKMKNLIFYSFPFSFFHRSSADKAPSEATFRGTEFLSYDLGQTGGEPIVSSQDAISLYFRTRQPNGLLFFTGELNYFVLFFHRMANNFFWQIMTLSRSRHIATTNLKSKTVLNEIHSNNTVLKGRKTNR